MIIWNEIFNAAKDAGQFISIVLKAYNLTIYNIYNRREAHIIYGESRNELRIIAAAYYKKLKSNNNDFNKKTIDRNFKAFLKRRAKVFAYHQFVKYAQEMANKSDGKKMDNNNSKINIKNVNI